MRITDVSTTELHAPHLPGIQDATIRHRGSGRGIVFVHVKTDDGPEGLGIGQPGTRELIWYTEFPEPKDGWWSPYPDRPGLGLTVDPSAIRRYAV